jgi:hypothetical protein
MLTLTRRNAAFGAVALSLKGIGAVSAELEGWQNRGRTMRGLNTLQSDGYIRSEGAVYASHPYSNGGPFLDIMPVERRALIKRTGFDFVRMAVDFGPILSASNRPALDVLIDDLLGHISAYNRSGLKVIVTMFAGNEPATGWGAKDLVDGVVGPKFQRLVIVWQRFAAAIAKSMEPAQVAIELFNEPPYTREIRGDPWPVQQKELFRQVRASIPKHTIIVTTDNLSSVDRLAALRAREYDANTMYRVNGYEPFQISHQGDGYFKYIRRLTFPPEKHLGGRAEAISSVTAEITLDDQLSYLDKVRMIGKFTREGRTEGIDTYFDTPCDRSFISSKVKLAVKWAASQGVSSRQILIGEFGARGDFNSGGLLDGPSDRLAGAIVTQSNFIRAWREEIEGSGFGGWCVHEALGPTGFGLGSGRPPWRLKPDLIAALGLKT